MSADDSGQHAAIHTSGVQPVLAARPGLLRQLFELAHAQLDDAIEMLDEHDESDPAPSVPPQ